jgi:hypothetical protein
MFFETGVTIVFTVLGPLTMSKYCERVHSLIAKTVSLVCKSSLPFEKEIKVEGLLGITLDENQVFLIRIDEIFAKLSGSSSEVSAVNYHEDRISAESRSQSEFTDIPSISTATSSVTSEANVPDNSTSKCTESFTPNNQVFAHRKQVERWQK